MVTPGVRLRADAHWESCCNPAKTELGAVPDFSNGLQLVVFTQVRTHKRSRTAPATALKTALLNRQTPQGAYAHLRRDRLCANRPVIRG